MLASSCIPDAFTSSSMIQPRWEGATMRTVKTNSKTVMFNKKEKRERKKTMIVRSFGAARIIYPFNFNFNAFPFLVLVFSVHFSCKLLHVSQSCQQLFFGIAPTISLYFTIHYLPSSISSSNAWDFLCFPALIPRDDRVDSSRPVVVSLAGRLLYRNRERTQVANESAWSLAPIHVILSVNCLNEETTRSSTYFINLFTVTTLLTDN